MSTTPNVPGYFGPMMKIVGSAVGSCTVVFALFKLFLQEVVPPYEGNHLSIGFASFISAILLLAVGLLMQKKVTAAAAQSIGKLCAGLALLALVLFIALQLTSRTFVYQFPPSTSSSQLPPKHYVRGILTDRGSRIVGGQSLETVVAELNGPGKADAFLWTDFSRRMTTTLLEGQYLLLVVTLNAALFTGALALSRHK